MFETGSFLKPFFQEYLPWLYQDSYLWTLLGLCGNVIFGSRIFMQWIATEKQKQVTVPKSYWWMSFFGALLNLMYAFHIDKLPSIIGGMGFLIYARNLYMMLKNKHANPAN